MFLYQLGSVGSVKGVSISSADRGSISKWICGFGPADATSQLGSFSIDWHPANEFTNFTAQTRKDAITDTIWCQLINDFIYKSLMNYIKKLTSICLIHITVIQHLSTADIDSFIRPFLHSLWFFACHGNTDMESVYSRCQTNAVAEASCI